jgi:hypothetical protein
MGLLPAVWQSSRQGCQIKKYDPMGEWKGGFYRNAGKLQLLLTQLSISQFRIQAGESVSIFIYGMAGIRASGFSG